MNEANQTPAADTIVFNIPGVGVKTIMAPTSLPAMTTPVTIDGYTQPGSSPNTSAVGSNAILLIEVSGPGGFFNNTDGFNLSGGGSTVRGLVINLFRNGIFIATGNNTITGNHIGTNDAGTVAARNSTGVTIISGNNIIGGTTPEARNVISGNSLGISLSGGANTLQGNYIGINAAGTAPERSLSRWLRKPAPPVPLPRC